jgi:hypothetical protein
VAGCEECVDLWCGFVLAVLVAWVGFFFLCGEVEVAASAAAAGSARPIVANRVLRFRITGTLRYWVARFRRVVQVMDERITLYS